MRAPTLLLVGGLDEQVITLNEQAQEALPDTAELTVIPGATHLFEEPGTLEQVAHSAADWFTTHLPSPTEDPPGRVVRRGSGARASGAGGVAGWCR